MWVHFLMQSGRPIAFFSKAMGLCYKSLSTYEKEFLSIVMEVNHWRSFLLGSHFKIFTDHQSLKYFMDQRLHTMFQQKWLTKLLGFEYTLHYKKGSENRVADALSRVSCSSMTAIQPRWLVKVQESYEEDKLA